MCTWKRLRVDRIARALPPMEGGVHAAQSADDVLACGDHVPTPSIRGAMESGRRSAGAVWTRVGGEPTS